MKITRMSSEAILSQADTDRINELLFQLNETIEPKTSEEIQAVARSSHLYLAIDPAADHRIVGMSTLVIVNKLAGIEGHIEDVVVHTDCRGQGLGRKLTQVLLDRAQELGIKLVTLTSRPSREAANALYKKMGFKKKETNVYTYSL